MKNYSVKQYIIFKVENGYAIQNETSFTVITEKKIIDFFLMLDKENRLMITQSYIDDYFGDSSENVIEFLIESNIMEHVVEKNCTKQLIFTRMIM